jgi:FkbM family methyltransferase
LWRLSQTVKNFQYLKRNTSTHDLKNVRIFNKGIWTENTTIPFQAEGNMGSSALAILGRNSNVQMVEVVTLDDALVLAGVSSLNAIKMDIEGAELEVLRSAESFLRRHRTPNGDRAAYCGRENVYG